MRSIITSVTSGIGTELARHWLKKGWEVHGTYRTHSPELEELIQLGLHSTKVDFSRHKDLDSIIGSMQEPFPVWDALVMCPATMRPIGRFQECDFEAWAESVEINFISVMKFIHMLLPRRNISEKKTPTVITWAGGGVNSAPLRYSAYTISKIAQLKMMELLDAEFEDTKFVIIGPGWVDTKIHRETLDAAGMAGDNHERTLSVINSKKWTPIEDVIDCCDWVIDQPAEVVSGRNFSVANGEWLDQGLSSKLRRDNDLFKLRRHGNAE